MDCVPGSVPKRLLPLACLAAFCFTATIATWGQQSSQKTSLPPESTDEIGKAKLADSPIEVLGGRLTVRVPQGAKVEARLFPIMGAAESEEHETRVVFDAGQERLVLMVNESFAFAGDDFGKNVKEWVTKWKGRYRIAPLSLSIKGLKAVVIVPGIDPDHSRSGDATFVEGIFVESDDRTIQSLDVYVNAAGEKDLKNCKTIAHQILLSVAPGKKTLQLEAGERRLSAIFGDQEISITVPKDTAVTTQVGPDFLVHQLIVLGRLGSNSGSIVVYVGSAPDYDPGARQSDGVMFGKKVEWHSLKDGQGLQTLCKLPLSGADLPPLHAHIIIQAPDGPPLKALREAAESMKLVKAKGSPSK